MSFCSSVNPRRFLGRLGTCSSHGWFEMSVDPQVKTGVVGSEYSEYPACASGAFLDWWLYAVKPQRLFDVV